MHLLESLVRSSPLADSHAEWHLRAAEEAPGSCAGAGRELIGDKLTADPNCFAELVDGLRNPLN